MSERAPRSWLFVPGAAERFVAKLSTTAAGARPDAVVFDLEDGVASGELDDARRRVAAVTAKTSAAGWLPATVAVRVHAVDHPSFEADMQALGQRTTTLFLPKVADLEALGAAWEKLAALGLPHLGIVAIIESAAGLQRAAEIATALAKWGHGGSAAGRPAARPATSHAMVPVRHGLAFGAEDFAADLGLPPTIAEGSPPDHAAQDGRLAVLDAARARIVTAAAAAGIACRVDTPCLRIGSDAQVQEEARRSRAMGFSGKFAVHPWQVEPIHRGFTPSASEVAWARSVLGAGPAQGAAGASRVAGQMVDEAVARQARAVLAAGAGTGGSGRGAPGEDENPL